MDLLLKGKFKNPLKRFQILVSCIFVFTNMRMVKIGVFNFKLSTVQTNAIESMQRNHSNL